MTENKANINWFPGHMAKTERELKENLKKVDLVAEVIDARIPISSQNPDISSIIGSKPRIIIINKSDLADKNQNEKWLSHFESSGVPAVLFSVKSSGDAANFKKKVNIVMKEKLEKWKSKGILNQSLRIMIVGIPNVGKSSIINRLARNSKAKVENRPGVTKRINWFSAGNNIEILDTPGVLWPKFESDEMAYNLAFTGAIKDQILDTENLAFEFIKKIKINYLDILCSKFGLDENLAKDYDALELINYIGKKRGMIKSGGEVDFLRTSNMILENYRNGKLGNLTLENL